AVDAVADVSVAYWFRNEQLPLDDVQLVLTVRGDMNGWLAECERRCTMEAAETLGPLALEGRRALFGQLEVSVGVLRTASKRPVERCGELAAKAGKVLHVWDVVAEPTWDFLCALTGRQAPARPFPFHRSKQLSWPRAPITPASPSGEDGPLRRAPLQVRP